jgi:hypothetical protein
LRTTSPADDDDDDDDDSSVDVWQERSGKDREVEGKSFQLQESGALVVVLCLKHRAMVQRNGEERCNCTAEEEAMRFVRDIELAGRATTRTKLGSWGWIFWWLRRGW